jgi:hypothetical protein
MRKLLAVLPLALLAAALPAGAAPPPNDNFADATVVTSLPFSDAVATGEAPPSPTSPSLAAPRCSTRSGTGSPRRASFG